MWGASLLLCDLAWRTAWIHSLGAPQEPPWWGLILLAGLLPMVAWFALFYLTGEDNYRELVAAGKINPPEVAAAINAVKLKPRKKPDFREDNWKMLNPKEFGKPDPGYGRRVSWASRALQGPLFFLWILVVMVLVPVFAMRLVENLLDRIQEELPVHFGGVFLGWLFGPMIAGAVTERRHKKIWAEIRASQQPPQ